MNAPTKGSRPFQHPGDKFLSPAEWLVRISEHMIRFKSENPNHPASQFRGHLHKEVHEAWQAATFGFAYGCAHHLGTLKVRHNRKQDSESDATFLWTENGREFTVPVQVKELPPATVNARETIEGLIAKIAKKYPTSRDLIVAVHLNRTEHHTRDIRFEMPVAQLWLWGWSKPDHSEITFTGGGRSRSRTFQVPFRVFTDMAHAEFIETPQSGA